MKNQTKADTVWQEILKSDTFCNQKLLKYFNGFQIWNVLVLWLKWTQTMEMKQNQTFLHGHNQIWRHIFFNFFYHKILKYFNDFQNQNFSLSRLKWTRTMEMKQKFFHGTYSNLKSFFIGHKILKYFNDFCNLHLSISLQKWA